MSARKSPITASVLTIWIAAVFSGGAALAYEIAWSRALVVPLGNAADAATLVLAAFMIGIGAGAWTTGKWAESVRSPLRLYVLVETFLGFYALCAPRLLSALSAFQSHGAVGLRWLAALALIAIPCLAMGASLPLLVRALTRPGSSLRWQVGVAYGANTVGGALGALATGFWGLAAVGIWRWSALAAIGSFAAACLAMLASRSRSFDAPSSDAPSSDTPSSDANDARAQSHDESALANNPTIPAAFPRLALGATFVMGFVVLANEMLWSRVLTFVFGHDTYAFAAMLAVVLVGLSSGGAMHRLLAAQNQASLLARLLFAFSASSVVSFWIAADLAIRRGRDPFGLGSSGFTATSPHLELARELIYTPILVFVPCIVAGVAFPAACSLYDQGSKHVGRVDPGVPVGLSIGRVSFANGIGSAFGTACASLAIGAVFNVQQFFVVLAFIGAAMATVTFVVSRPFSFRNTGFASIPIVAVGLTCIAMPPSLPRNLILASAGPNHQTLLHYEDARTGTVSVIENQINGERQLLMNAVNEVTTRLVHDQSFKVLGHLAPLLHPNPKQGIMICLGAGISAGAALTHPLDGLDVVDLSSAVQRGARYFNDVNNNALDDPRFRLHIGDGRQFLLNTHNRYDVAIVDSTHPKAVDSWILYTFEFYELLNDRLADGGIAVQWVPLHGLSEREFKIIVRTFQTAFPKMTLWANVGFETYGRVGYAKLVGIKNDALAIDVPRLEERLRNTKAGEDLAPWGMRTVEDLLDQFVAGPDSISAWTEGLPVQTDDHPIIPYTTAFTRGRRMVPSLLLGVREPITPWLTGAKSEELEAAIELAAEAQGLVIAGNLIRAQQLHPSGAKLGLFEHQTATTLPYYKSLAATYPNDAGKQFEAATQLATLGHADFATPMYQRALELRPRDFRTRLDFAHTLLGIGNVREAIDVLIALRDEYPHSAIVHYNLGAAAFAWGDASAAAGHLETALAYDDNLYGARVELARTRLATNDLARCKRELDRALDDNPFDADVHHLTGLLYARQGLLLDARRHLKRARSLDPFRATFTLDAGLVFVRQGDLEGAEQAFRSMIRYHPSQVRGMQELGDLLTAQARWSEAADAYLGALEVDPVYVPAAIGLGSALRAEGKRRQSIDAYCLVLRIDSNNIAAQTSLREMDADCVGDQAE